MRLAHWKVQAANSPIGAGDNALALPAVRTNCWN
jgi:hypothetical protein